MHAARSAVLALALAGCHPAQADETLGDQEVIFTSVASGNRVEGDLYSAKRHAYLVARGLPAGDYFFTVTDDRGTTLLSTDHISCRRIQISDDGVIVQGLPGTTYTRVNGAWLAADCRHATSVDRNGRRGSLAVHLMPYHDTPTGGFKVWVTRVSDYIGDPNRVPSVDDDTLDGIGGFIQAKSTAAAFQVPTAVSAPKP